MAVPRAATVELSPARLSDARELAEISRLHIEHGLGWRWQPASLFQHIRGEDSCVVVARDGKRIIGFAVMSFGFEERSAHLLLLAVIPGERRAGIGTRLLAWLERIARLGGIARLQLEVRATAVPAQRLYEARGFQVLGRVPGYYQGREDAIRMQKRLV